MSTTYRVFISAVSGELKSYRQEVTRGLRRKGLQVVVQEDFHQGPGTLLEKLRDTIEHCDAVIALIGERSGLFPSEEHVSPLGSIPLYERYCAPYAHSRPPTTQCRTLLARPFR